MLEITNKSDIHYPTITFKLIELIEMLYRSILAFVGSHGEHLNDVIFLQTVGIAWTLHNKPNVFQYWSYTYDLFNLKIDSILFEIPFTNLMKILYISIHNNNTNLVK